MDRLVELFRAMEVPRGKTVQGFWAELLLMARSRRPEVLLRAWHSVPEDRYDFSDGPLRIEVKSAVGGVRVHHFSLAQLLPVAGVRVVVASVLVQRAGGGTSVADLLALVRGRAGGTAELLLHADRVTALTLGASWRAALDERFDLEVAERSLRFFDSSAVPAPSPVLPPGVSEVSFRADLSTVPSVGPEWMRGSGHLFEAALPT
jgi:hypothetical protein